MLEEKKTVLVVVELEIEKSIWSSQKLFIEKKLREIENLMNRYDKANPSIKNIFIKYPPD